MYIYMYMYIYIHTHMYTYMYRYVYIYIYTYIGIHIHIFIARSFTKSLILVFYEVTHFVSVAIYCSVFPKKNVKFNGQVLRFCSRSHEV